MCEANKPDCELQITCLKREKNCVTECVATLREIKFHCKSFFNAFSLTSASNENKLRGKTTVSEGWVREFYGPIKAMLIYSNVEVWSIQRLDFDSFSRSIAF